MTDMKGFANFFIRQAAAFVLDGTSPQKQLAGTYNLRVSTTSFDMDGDGLTEPTDPSYAPINLGPDVDPQFQTEEIFASYGIAIGIENAIDLEWPTATESWGFIEFILLSVNLTSTPTVISPVWGGKLSTHALVNTGDTLTALAEDIVVFCAEDIW